VAEKEVKRIEQLVEKTEADMAVEPEIPRPKFWKSEVDRYEWCFRLVHEHGREISHEDKVFMESFEAAPKWENYRERFEDLKLIL
jgi:hypothetical protein